MRRPETIAADVRDNRIAIVGIGCRFPGADGPESYWRNLRDGVESVTFFDEAQLAAEGVSQTLRDNPDFVPAQAVLEDEFAFDASFFGLSPREADIMDPQHRLMLECSWEAIEDSGRRPDRLDGKVAVFAGGYRSDYLQHVPTGGDAAAAFARDVANDSDYLATRVSYQLNLTGPSVTVQTACSTSLVAVHLACQSLLLGESDTALAGGATVRSGHQRGYVFQPGGILSSDGHCRAFDAAAEGTVIGEGVGVVVLRRLADAIADGDPIRAVILGSSVGNDGSERVGFTAPGVHGQSEIVRTALQRAGVHPHTIGYVETHGSGTPLGDRIEVDALDRAFRDAGWQHGECAIGSVKTNIGHTHAAAGIAGLIKTVLALQHRMLPPTLHFERPNPRIRFGRTPFRVVDRLTAWTTDSGPLRAGVSSFGLGGTGAHVVLERAPEPATAADDGDLDGWHLLPVSANTAQSAERIADRLAARLAEHPGLRLADVARTLQCGRRHFRHRRLAVARDLDGAVAALRGATVDASFAGEAADDGPPVALLLTGLGDQYPQMGRQLYETEPIFRATVDDCAALLKQRSGIDLLGALYPGPAPTDDQDQGPDLRRLLGRDTGAAGGLSETELAQPALFVVEYALAKLLEHWGVQPDALIGYSLGEYVAACLSGVLTLEDALTLVTVRAELIGRLSPGAMLAVPLSEARIRPLLGGSVSLAAVNGPDMCVLSGELDAIAGIEADLGARGLATRRLNASRAFHSVMMDPIVEEFTELVSGFTLKAPAVPYLSNVTGDWITDAEATDPAYWARHLRQPIRFADGVVKLCATKGRVLLEVGPGSTLGGIALRHQSAEADAGRLVLATLPPSFDRRSAARFLRSTLGKLWIAGVPVRWPAIGGGNTRVALPTTPFNRREHRVTRRWETEQAPPRTTALTRKENLAEWFSVPCWEPLPPLPAGAGAAVEPSTWLVFLDDLDVGDHVVARLIERGHRVAAVRPGEASQNLGDGRHTVRPDRVEDYAELLRELERTVGTPRHIVHCWTVTSPQESPDPGELRRRAFDSLLFLAQALGGLGTTPDVAVTVVSNDLHPLDGSATQPLKALLLGPCQVWPREAAGVACRSVDVSLAAPASRRDPLRALDALVEQLHQPVSDTQIALRGAARWRRTFLPAELHGTKADNPRLRPGGTYVITGGLGGMGLELAGHLARTTGANLVLLGRHGLPARAEWDDVVGSPGADAALVRRIESVRRLEELGSQVEVVRADVTDAPAVAAAMRWATDRFGAVHGVVHAAGVPGGGLMQLKDPEAAARVLAPKVAGTLALLDACREIATDLDFVLLCSSLLSVTGGLGQVDYCAANAFLDAVAHHHEALGDLPVTAVNWDAWREVGMAEHAAAGAVEAQHPTETGHPLLPRRLGQAEQHAVYAADFSVEGSWLVDEHRMLGYPVVPGTGHLELVRAAVSDHSGGELRALSDITFMSPIVLDEERSREVRVVLDRTGEEYEFSVVSRYDGTAEWQLNSTGRATVGDRDAPPAARHLDVASLIGTGGLRPVERLVHEGPMGFSGRSRCLEWMSGGDREFLALLALPEQFAHEVADLPLHPSLMDLATAFVGLYAAEEFRIPISYGRLTQYAPLTARVYSHHRYAVADDAGRETLSADVTITDLDGRVLVEIEGFVLKRTGDLTGRLAALCGGTSDNIVAYHFAEAARERETSVPAFLRQQLEQGIRPEEGVAAFDRIVAAGPGPQVAVCTQDLDAVMAQVVAEGAQTSRPAAPAGPAHPRPLLMTPYTAPRGETEGALAALWQGLLGLDRVGAHDNFFELGGHSLLGIQLAARLRADLGVEVALGTIFNALTVAELAAVVERLRDEAG
ncbi:type I polyketide synthase [Dactylosporangium fulvum]|uniref:SDR family NAD(P)-dependent oxidoreductase n=1 Tax=Dactylosporangium fulvum TaxID=53359 RepID=A0ABY5W846_9ACTN|nr:type I polyketide synthase [Dactylosporangium fulvum]UWP85399.1 SDR family NAD(P)-dependent oxidoreductase [Dactylosporangium fulvum]